MGRCGRETTIFRKRVEKIISPDRLLNDCQDILGENGQLAKTLPGFSARSSQITLGLAIANAIEKKSILVSEAGTGTGKTFAYLVPCLLSRKKVLISTATKTLQDQLFQKDLPLLIKALGIAVTVQNLKGRANYLCLHRIERHVTEGLFLDKQTINDILLIKEKIPRFIEGERSELPEISEDSSVWPYVTSTTDNCLGSQCTHLQTCFLFKARKRAMEAQVVVINHHLFFADTCLKEDGFGELLPGVDIIIFDEAHQIAQIAAYFKGERVGTKQIRDLMEDILKEWPVLDLANQPLKSLYRELQGILDDLLLQMPPHDEKHAWEVLYQTSFKEGFTSLCFFINQLIDCVRQGPVNEHPGLQRCLVRLETIKLRLDQFQQVNKSSIKWVERFKQSLVFNITPYDLSDSFQELIEKKQATIVFTSATLTISNSFDCFLKPLGLSKVETLMLQSPFDYKNQALLYLPRGLPDPKALNYHEILLQKVLPIINACGGKSFFLFTSHKALKQVAHQMVNLLKYPVLVQGEEAKPILLKRFRLLGNAVLLGTSTFWEGVDVKGEALSCVIIDKLPFASPNDPVVRGKMLYLDSKGLSSFDELSLPHAVLALKQGVGRLIRDIQDRGVLVLADPRLTGREYGRRIFLSLPDLTKTRNEQQVLTFIEKLALTHEPPSH